MDPTDNEMSVGVVLSTAPPQTPVTRARTRRPRKPTMASLNAQVEAFEFVVKHLPYVLRDLEDPSAKSEEDESTNTGDDDAQRICAFLRRTIVLSRQAQKEIAKQTEYLRLLKRHYEGTANLRKLMRGLRLDNWFWMCERWRELTRLYYEPLSELKCYTIMQEALQAIKTHKLTEGVKGNDAFGWRDCHHLDEDQHLVRFMICKTLRNADMKQLVDHSWSTYSDGDLFKTAHLGDSSDVFLEVLQRISYHHPERGEVPEPRAVDPLAGHRISCADRDRVYDCISLHRVTPTATAGEGGRSQFDRTFLWETFDVAHRDARGECDAVRFTLAGSIGADNPTYAKRARDEILISLVRYEIRFMDSPISSAESATDSNRPAEF